MSGIAAYFLVYMSNQIVLQTLSYIKQVFTVNRVQINNGNKTVDEVVSRDYFCLFHK